MYRVQSGNGYVLSAILRLAGSDATLTGCQPGNNLSNQSMFVLQATQPTLCYLHPGNAAFLESQTQTNQRI